MIESVVPFFAGFTARSACSSAYLPNVQFATKGEYRFKVYVRIISASIPALGSGGVLTKERPYFEVSLGASSKETEVGEFRRDKVGSCYNRYWSFDETLMFNASIDDILDEGVALTLLTNSDVRLGPFQVTFADSRELGLCIVNLRRHVLPKCSMSHGDTSVMFSSANDGNAGMMWETDVLDVPLSVHGCLSDETQPRVRLRFFVNADPDALIQAADHRAQGMVERISGPVSRMLSFFEASLASCGCDVGGKKLRRSVSRRLPRKVSMRRIPDATDDGDTD